MADLTFPTALQQMPKPVMPIQQPNITTPGSQSSADAPASPPVSPIQDMLNVNFVRDQRARQMRVIEKDKAIAKYVAWAVAIFIVILIAVVVVEFLLSMQDKKVGDSITETKTRLTGLSSLEKEYLVYAQKLKLMYTLDTARATKQEATNYFYTLVPPVNILKSVTTDNDQQKPLIGFTIQSPDVFTLLDLLKLFSAQTVTDKGYMIQNKNLSRDADGTYTFDGTLDYSKAAGMKKTGAAGG
ncbi:MAG TPA: hypothetical protein VFG51_02815 [Candidatus Saccharimonadia bacterium]|nr:hypothetical protein [Candidatus Saccharimonadia bacterium]